MFWSSVATQQTTQNLVAWYSNNHLFCSCVCRVGGVEWEWLISLPHGVSWVPQLGLGTYFQMAHSHAQQGAGCWFGAQHVYGTGALAPITQLSPWPSWASTQQGSWVPRASISREQSESTWHFCKLDRSRIWSLLAYSVVWDSHKRGRRHKPNHSMRGASRSHCEESKWEICYQHLWKI